MQYCLSSAENFAAGAVYLLDALGAVDEISFGSECGDVESLLKAMETVDLAAVTHADEIRAIMEKGYTYPRALNSVVNGYDAEAASMISEPNNLLAIEYLRALKKSGSNMTAFTVKRKNAAHDSAESEDGFASASLIREMIENRADIGAFTTPEWAAAIAGAVEKGETASLSRLERVMLYKLRTCSTDEI